MGGCAWEGGEAGLAANRPSAGDTRPQQPRVPPPQSAFKGKGGGRLRGISQFVGAGVKGWQEGEEREKGGAKGA
eukprot:15448847-Alexandrium_andersonii.AAC.1